MSEDSPIKKDKKWLQAELKFLDALWERFPDDECVPPPYEFLNDPKVDEKVKVWQDAHDTMKGVAMKAIESHPEDSEERDMHARVWNQYVHSDFVAYMKLLCHLVEVINNDFPDLTIEEDERSEEPEIIETGTFDIDPAFGFSNDPEVVKKFQIEKEE